MLGRIGRFIYVTASYWPLAAAIVVWEVAAKKGWINAAFLPAPSDAVITLFRLAQDGILLPAIGASLWRIVQGFTCAALIGTALAIASSLIPIVRRNLLPLVEVLRPISPIAWVPLAILWFAQPGAFIVFIAAIFPIFLYTTFGLVSAPPSALLAAQTFRATAWQKLVHVVIPAALPALLAGLRLAIGLSWMSVIAAELFAVQSGLGYQIELSRLSAAPQEAIGLMFVVGLLGLLMSAGVGWIERRLIPWRKPLGMFEGF